MNKKPRNMLSPKDTFRLNSWVMQNQDNFTGMTRERIAADASKAMGVEVTVGNLLGALRVFDIQLPPGSRANHTNDRAQIIAREFSELCKELGRPVPPSIHAIATRRKVAQ